jgi:hypothetical protein
MNYLSFSHPFRKGFQVLLLLAILMFNVGVSVAYAAPPSNDSFANATVVGAIAFSSTVDTSQAVVDDPTDPTNIPCEGANLLAGYKSIWYKYTAPVKGIVEADTIGTDQFGQIPNGTYDTFIAVWTGTALNNLALVACNDSIAASQDAQVTWKAQVGVTYYIYVAQYKCATPCIPEPLTTVSTLQFHMNFGGGPDTAGVFRPSNGLLYLKNKNDTGFADIALNYGLGGDYPVVGDWDGNGTVTIGVYRNGYFYLRNQNTIGFAQIVFPFGTPGDQPIAGDWNGDGVDTIGVFRPTNAQFFLRNSNSEGPPDVAFFLGNPGDVGLAGDWNNDEIDSTGVFRPSNGVIFLKDTNDSGFANYALNYGLPGDQPVTGDWDGDGDDTIGVYRGGQFYLRDENTNGFATNIFGLGIPGDMPIAGNWDGIPNP